MKIKKGASLLFALNPVFNKIKERIIDSFTVSVIKNISKTKQSILNILGDEYNIKLDELVLKNTLSRLRNDGYIEIDKNKSKNLTYYKIKKKGSDLIEYLDNKKTTTKEEIHKWISKIIPSDLREEYNKYKNVIILDFIQASSVLTENGFFDLLEGKEYLQPLKVHKCNLRKISTELKKFLNNTYSEYITLDSQDPLIRKVINISLFWNCFIKLALISEDKKDLINDYLDSAVIFLDTNILIASICHFDPNYKQCSEYLKFLENLGVKLVISKKTMIELMQHLEKNKKVAHMIKYYPDISLNVVNEAGSPILEAYFKEGYRNWDYYKKEFLDGINKKFHLYSDSYIKDQKIDLAYIDRETKKITDRGEILGKKHKIAEHDAYLITLVKKIRNTNKNVWFEKYSDWILTLDTILLEYEKAIGVENEAPTSIFLSKVPYYFYPFGIFKAFASSKIEITETHDFLIDASWIIQNEKKVIKKNIGEYSTFKSNRDLENKLIEYTKEILWS